MDQKKSEKRKMLDSISIYLDSKENVVKSIKQFDCYNDYPFFYYFGVTYLTDSNNKINLYPGAGSMNKDTAYIKAIMEGIERWYIKSYGKKDFLLGSYNELKEKVDVLNPNDLQVVSKTQLESKKYARFKFSPDTPFNWIKVNKLIGEGHKYIPTQLIYLSFNNNEPCIRIPDSTGAAAGFSMDEAIYRGLCEVIERDAYTIFYLNRLPVNRININTIPNPEVRKLIAYLKDYHFYVELFDITLDIKVPVFLCLLIDKTDIGPKVVIGLKCDISSDKAIYGAIIESMQGLIRMRDLLEISKFLDKALFKKYIKKDTNLNRVFPWTDPKSLSQIDYLLGLPRKEAPLLEEKEVSYKNKVANLVKRLLEAGIKEAYWAKLTPRELDKFNIYSTKVIVPALQPMPHKDFIYLKGERIMNVPVKLKLRSVPIQEREVNLFPHPLP